MLGRPLGRGIAALALTGAVLAGCGSSSGGGVSSTTTVPAATSTPTTPLTKPSATAVAPARTTPTTPKRLPPRTTPTTKDSTTPAATTTTTTTQPAETPLARCLGSVAAKTTLTAAQRKLLDEVCVKIGGTVQTGTTH